MKKGTMNLSTSKDDRIGIYFKLFMKPISIHQIIAIVDSFCAGCGFVDKTTPFFD